MLQPTNITTAVEAPSGIVNISRRLDFRLGRLVGQHNHEIGSAGVGNRHG